MQTRKAKPAVAAYTMELQKQIIPQNAVLRDFRVRTGHEGLAPNNFDVASFDYEG